MTTATIQSQKLVTPATFQLIEFDFSDIVSGGSSVYLSTEHGEDNTGYIPLVFNNITYTRVDMLMSGIRCDLTGSVAEPKLSLAADTLWAIPSWASAISSFSSLMDYRGLRVKRQRIFFGTVTDIAPQTFYVKSVDELSATTISFTLTPSLGSDRLDRPSARKLEL
jgi:phage-related protein